MKRCLAILLSLLGPSSSFAAESSWRGDPDAILSADNPYLKLAELNVTFSLAAEKPEVFWLVWGATAPESKRRGDAKLRARALAETQKLADTLREKPVEHWDIGILLESILRWKKAGDVPAAKLADWLDGARASVEKNFIVQSKGLAGDADAEWVTFAPNALLQSAAILALADKLYGEPRYGEMARQLVRRTAPHQLPGGAFSYIRDSGPSALYYGFESTFLARYYQLTRDPEAARMLVAMAGYARDAQANGLIQGSSAPWWKHHWGTGGAIHGIEAVAGMSSDPLARALAAKRLERGQSYYFSHVSMYFWDGDISPGSLGADLCELNPSIRGPQLRRDGWEVVMPMVPFGDTVVGASLSGDAPLVFENYLQAAALPILLKDTEEFRGRDESLFMIAPEEVARGGVCVGDGWIATGRVYRPRRGSYGEATVPAAEGWTLAQVWFADAHGVAGWLRASRSGEAVAGQRPVGALEFGGPVVAAAGRGDQLASGSLVATFFGTQVRNLRGQGLTGRLDLVGNATRDVFEYGVAVDRKAKRASTTLVAMSAAASRAVVTQVMREGERPVWLLFNPTGSPVSVLSPAVGWLARSSTGAKVGVDESTALQAGELAVLFAR